MTDFEGWYEREHPRVLAACCALGGNFDVAREATDEAFVRAFERWSRVGEMAAPGGWVQVVALNQLRRSLRRRRVEATFLHSRSGGVPPAQPPPDVELWMVVGGLPPRQQEAVVLRYVHGLPEKDIAEAMGVARGTVASSLNAAQASLRRHMTEPITSEEPVHG